jgi:hypothetical protein
MKKIKNHLYTYSEIYQVIMLGAAAIAWLICRKESWPEPLFVIITIIFAAISLRKLFLKGNVDEELEKTISRSHPIDDWYSNHQFTNNEHIAVYKKQPAITIVLSHIAMTENFQEDWLNELYPNHKHQVIRYRFSTTIMNYLIKRFYLLMVLAYIYRYLNHLLI